MTITLTPETTQEAFDIMYKHLLSMTERCSIEHSCRYRKYGKPEDERCPVGALIADEDYYPTVDSEEKNVGALIRDGILAVKEGVEQKLLSEVQRVHDSCLNWDDEGLTDRGLTDKAVDDLRTIAKLYDLTVPEEVAS